MKDKRRTAADWVLEGMGPSGEGGSYLVDRDSGLIYAIDSPLSWPIPVGWLTDTGRVERVVVDMDGWCKRVQHIFENNMQVRRVFAGKSQPGFNRDCLGFQQLKEVLSDLLGESTQGQVLYLAAALGVDRGVQMELKELVQAGQQAGQVYQSVLRMGEEAVETLHHASQAFARSREAADELFNCYDVNHDGTLDPLEVLWLCKALMPTLMPLQLKYIVAYLQVEDIRGHGEFSYRELLQILRAVPVHMPHGCHPGTFTRPAVLGASPASKRRQWAPRSSVAGRVSEDGEGAAASLLMPAGEEGPLALCASLTAAIQSNADVFDATFQQFDRDGSQGLDVREFKNFAEAVLGRSVLVAEAHSVIAILDVSGDGCLSKSELKDAVQDLSEYHQQLWSDVDRGQSIQVLDRVVSWLTDNKEDAHKLFLECTASGRAYLPSNGLGEFVRRVEPEAGDADRRLVVANIVRRIQRFDGLASGRITFQALMHGARDIKARLIHTITHQKRDAFGHVSNAAALRAIYCDLHGFCKEDGRKHLMHHFRKAGGAETLPITKIEGMLVGLLGIGHREEVRYFVAMLQARCSPKRSASMGDIEGAVAEGRMILQQVASKVKPPTAEDLIAQLAVYFQDCEDKAHYMFNQADDDKDGAVEPHQIEKMVRAFQPTATPWQLQLCIAWLQTFDSHRTGRLTFPELQNGLAEQLERWNGLWESLGEGEQDALQPREHMIRLIKALEQKLKRNRAKFGDFFNRFSDSNGRMNFKGLQRFLREILGNVDMPTVRYFQAIVDINGDNAITLEELSECIQETISTVAKVSKGELVASDQRLRSNLQAIADKVLSQPRVAREVFDRCDENRDGRLEPAELRVFLKHLQPMLRKDDCRMLLAHFQSMDINRDGVLSFDEVADGMQAHSSSRRSQLGSGQSDWRSRYSGSQPNSRIGSNDGRTLSLTSHDGRPASPPSLLSRESSFSSGPPSPTGAHPQRSFNSPYRKKEASVDDGANNQHVEQPQVLEPPQSESPPSLPEPEGTAPPAMGLLRLYDSMLTCMKENQIRFSELFNRYDRSGRGRLSMSDLYRFAADVLDVVDRSDVKYLQAMLDANGDGFVSLMELKNGLREGRHIAAAMADGSVATTMARPATLEGLQRALADTQDDDLVRLFKQCDVSGNGYLEPSEVGHLVRELAPEAGLGALRLSMALIYASDTDGDGRLSMREVGKWYRAVREDRLADPAIWQRRPKRLAAPTEVRDSLESELLGEGDEHVEAAMEEVQLQALVLNGKQYLYDPVTRGVHRHVEAGAAGREWGQRAWPERIGYLTAGGQLRLDSNRADEATTKLAELYNCLYKFMKDEHKQFREKFAEYDSRGCGKLRKAEMRRLLQHVLGEVSSHEVEYLWAMLDINDDGEVSVEEFKSALREVKDVADGMREDHERRMEAEKLRVLNQISGELVARKVRAKTLFMRHSHGPHGGCTPRKGYLQPSQVGAFLAELLPGLSRREVRFGMLHLFGLLDADGDGRISFGEFVKGLRAVHMILPSGTLQPGFRPSSGGSSPWHSPRGDRPPATPQGDSCGLGTGGSEPMELTLEEYEHKGRLLLLEPATRTLFDPRAEEVDDEGTGWPMRVGYLTSGGAVRLTQATSGGSAELARLYQAVDAFIKESGMRFDELFAQFDSSGSGKLRMEQLQHLLDAVVGMVSAGQAQYLQAMLDTDGDGAVTLAEFKAAMREVSEVVLMGAGDVRAEQKALAERLSRALRQDPERTQALFQELDQARRGYLDPPLLMRFIRALLPGLSSRQARLAVDHLGRTMDANGDGRVSFKELLLGLRAVNLRQPSTCLPARSHPVRNDGDWQLQNFEHAGEPLLLDPASQRLYTLRADAPGEAPWPHEVGSLAEGGEVRLHSASGDGTEKLAQVYNAINDYIQDGGERLAALFKQFDTSRTGALRMEDLAAFLAEMVGDTPTSSVYYIHAMLDIDGDGLVTLPELKSALLEVKDVAASMEAAQGAELDREKRAALDALSRELRANQGRARELFQAHDVGDKGYLRPHEVRALIKGLLPAISARHLRLCLAHMCRMDTDQDGRISLFEFLHGLRAIQPRTSSGAAIFAGFAANPGHAPKESMEQVAIQERNLLIREPTLNDGSLDGILDDMGLSDDGGNVAHQSVGSFENLLEFETSVAELQSECSFTADEGADAEEERWELHELWHRGERLLLDRRTNWLYRCQRDGGWPERVGHLTDNGDVVLGVDSATLGQGVMELAKVYNTALKYMEEEHLRFQELFARYDTSGAGRLQLDDLHNMLEEMLGQVSGAQVLFLHAMLDVNGDGLVTLEEFRSALRQVAEVADGLRSHHDSELEAERHTTMAKLSQAMMKRKKRAKKLFRKLAGAKDWLAPPALGQLIRELVPGLSAREQRVALAYMLRMDADADGRVSWPEFLQGLRAVQVAVPSGTAPDVQMGFPTEAPSSFPPHLGEARPLQGGDTSEWILEEVEYDGAPLLLDPATRVLYSVEEEENASGWWPRRFGSLASDGTVCPDHELSAGVAALAALYNGLQAAMDAEGVRFSQLFQQYDSSGRGLLAMDDLGRFLADMLGDGAPAEEAGLLYLQAMLDANGDGAVSEAEFRAALREVAEVAEGVRAEAAQREDAEAREEAEVLAVLSEALVERQADARALFRQLDTRRSGRLRPPQVAQLTRRLLPSLMPRQLRLALAHLLALDADGDGQLSWGELVHGMRATRVRLPEGGALEGGFRARMVGSASHAGRRPGENQPKPLPHETFSFHPDSAELMLPPATKTAKDWHPADASSSEAARRENPAADAHLQLQGVEAFFEAAQHVGHFHFELEGVLLKRQAGTERLLLERRTNLVYVPVRNAWPRLAGCLKGDRFVHREAMTPGSNIFSALCRAFTGYKNEHHFNHLFNELDGDRDGWLSLSEVQRLASQVFQVTPGQLEHMSTMLSLQPGAALHGRPLLSAETLRTGLLDCAELSTGALAGRPAALAALDNISNCMGDNPRAAWESFLELAGAPLTGDPELSQRQLSKLLSSLDGGRAIDNRDVQSCLAYLHSLDVDGTGQLGFLQLLQALRCVTVCFGPPNRRMVCLPGFSSLAGSCNWAESRPAPSAPSSPPKSRRRVQSEAPPQPPQPQPPLDLASEMRESWPPPSRKPSGGTVRYASHSALPHAGHTGAGSLAEELHQVEPRTEEVHAPEERKPEAGLSLVDALLDGCLVLVHRPSGLVFRQATERAWPELVGRLDGEGQLGAASAAALATSQPSPLAVMFHLLEALLEALHQLEDGRLVELFLQADPSAQGLGGAATLEAVVRPVLPDLRPQEAALLTGLLGAHPWPRMMGPSNLVEVLADGLAAVAMAADARSSLAVLPDPLAGMLADASRALCSLQRVALAMFEALDTSCAGTLHMAELLMVLRLVQPQAEAARLQMVAAYVMDHHACRSGRVTFEALMFSMRCVKLVAGSQTFHPEAAFPGLAQATAEAAQVDLELLVGTPTEVQRIAMHKELRTRHPHVYPLLQSPELGADGRISEEALMEIRMAIAGIQEERGGAMQHMSVGGVAAAEDKPAVQAGLMRKLRVAALQGGQLREAYGAVASKSGGLLEQHHLPQLLQQLAPDLPQAGVQYCCAMLQSHGGGTQPLDLPDLESIITHAAQLEYLLQDNGQLTSAMQHLVAALEADIQRDYPRAEQIWTDVSGCAPSQGIGLQKVLAVAARLPQQQLQSRECRTLTAILAAALPAACWLPRQGDPPSARKAHRVPATDPSSLRRSLQSDGHRLSLPRFTRLLTQLSLFGLADTEPASLVAERSHEGGALPDAPSGMYALNASTSRASLGGSPSVAWSSPTRRPAGPHAYSPLKGDQYQSGEAGGSQWSSPDPAGSPSVPAEDWAADSLPPGYLEWVQAQHGSAMWLWQQDQARKASEAAMQREMSLRDAEVSDLKAKMSDLELELEQAKEALAKPRPGLGIDLDASDCSSSDSRNEAQTIVNKLLKQVHTLGKVMESGGLPGEAADSEAAIAHQTLLQRLPSLVAEGDPSEIIAWMEEEWRRETAPMEDELQILRSRRRLVELKQQVLLSCAHRRLKQETEGQLHQPQGQFEQSAPVASGSCIPSGDSHHRGPADWLPRASHPASPSWPYQAALLSPAYSEAVVARASADYGGLDVPASASPGTHQRQQQQPAAGGQGGVLFYPTTLAD